MPVKYMKLKVVGVEFGNSYYGRSADQYHVDVLLIVRLRQGLDWHVSVGYELRDVVFGRLAVWKQDILRATAPQGDVEVTVELSESGRRYLKLSEMDMRDWQARAKEMGIYAPTKGEAEEMVRKAKEVIRSAEVAQAATATAV